MYRLQRAQDRKQVEARTATASEASAISPDQLNFWRSQASQASERERKALAQAAAYQRDLEVLEKKYNDLRKKIMDLLD